MARLKVRMTRLVSQYQIPYYHMITVSVKGKLGILEVIEEEGDSFGTPAKWTVGKLMNAMRGIPRPSLRPGLGTPLRPVVSKDFPLV